MRGFEQFASKPRCDLMQFHRLMMLKLETVKGTLRGLIVAPIASAGVLQSYAGRFFVCGKRKEEWGYV